MMFSGINIIRALDEVFREQKIISVAYYFKKIKLWNIVLSF